MLDWHLVLQVPESVCIFDSLPVELIHKSSTKHFVSKNKRTQTKRKEQKKKLTSESGIDSEQAGCRQGTANNQPLLIRTVICSFRH